MQKHIVAADGATSLVRRKLHCHANVHASRLLEILTPKILKRPGNSRNILQFSISHRCYPDSRAIIGTYLF